MCETESILRSVIIARWSCLYNKIKRESAKCNKWGEKGGGVRVYGSFRAWIECEKLVGERERICMCVSAK